MSPARLELAVGCFVVAAFAVLMWATLKVGALPAGLFGPEGRELVARFENVSGLEEETEVLIAGVPVGRVAKIDLDGREARVTLRVEEPDVEIPIDSIASIRSRGFLGERVIEIVPGRSLKTLAPGGVFTRTHDAPDVDKLLQRADVIAADLGEVSATFRNVFGGPEGEEAMQEMLGNLRVFTADLRRSIENNGQAVERILLNLDSFSADLVELTDGGDVQIKTLLLNLQESSGKLNEALGSLSSISARVERGEGTLGKLLGDESLYLELDAAIGEVRATLREVRRAAEEAQEQIPATILTTIFGTVF